MVRRSTLTDSALVPHEDDHVSDHGYVLGVLVLERSDHDGSGRCGYGHDEHDCDEHDFEQCDCEECDRDVNGRDEGGHCVDGHFHAGDQYGNDLSDHVRRANAHARDVHGRRRSCR